MHYCKCTLTKLNSGALDRNNCRHLHCWSTSNIRLWVYSYQIPSYQNWMAEALICKLCCNCGSIFPIQGFPCFQNGPSPGSQSCCFAPSVHHYQAGSAAHIVPLSLPPTKARSQWMKIRNKDWWERVVLTEFTDWPRAHMDIQSVSFARIRES